MSPSRTSPVIAYLFGPFRLSVQDRILEREGERVLLTPKVIDTLFVLVENAGEVVTKEALMRAVWPDVTVVESGLTRNMSVLRKALEQGLSEGAYIETIPRRGYRFVAEVTRENSLEPPIDFEEPAAPPRRRWRHWAVPVAAIGVIGVLGVWLLLPARPAAQLPVEPRVRIGEHPLYKLAPEQSVRAADEFEHAIAATPDSAAAHAGLAIALLQTFVLGMRPLSEIGSRAEAEAKRAVELDGGLSTAHYASGLVDLVKNWRLEAAEQSFRRALAAEPGSVQTRFGYAQLKFATGEIQEAIRLIEEALRLDPASPLLGARYCQAFYYERDFRRAESECRKVLDREPRYLLAQYYLALSLGWLGRLDEARQLLDESSMRRGVIETDLVWLSLRAGDERPAVEAFERLRDWMRAGKLHPSAMLLPAVMLGRIDEAYEAVEAAVRERAIEMLTFYIDPRLDGLRSDRRYRDVLRRIGVPPESGK